LVAQYADACNLIAEPRDLAHKLDVLRQHCDAVGRDPNDIEVTATFAGLPPSPTADEIVRGAEEFAALGVSALVTRVADADPARALEDTFGPAMDRLGAIEPARLAQ
jgi:alkanesulfonate monooxygenase SsuD/methylene tetrahydromethanopterin reductase-like flavin-dependent oxidoreductase (luciferase family)